MLAAVVESPGRRPAIQAVDLLEPGPGEVRVRVVAAGVCHSDLTAAAGAFGFPFPLIPGHEAAGVIDAVSEGSAAPPVGTPVILSWLQPCRRCRWCRLGRPSLCARSGATVARAQLDGRPVHAAFGVGAFAEAVVVPSGCAVPYDDRLAPSLAALVGCGVATGVGSVFNVAAVGSGESVAVLGCGGVGLATIQAARAVGAAPVLAVDRHDQKLRLALAAGATDVVDAATEDVVQRLLKLSGGGVDHAFEVVGNGELVRVAYEAVRRGGNVTVVGAAPPDDKVVLPAARLMSEGKIVRGSVYGDIDPAHDFARLVAMQLDGSLDLELLVSGTATISELPDAMDALARGDAARTIITFD